MYTIRNLVMGGLAGLTMFLAAGCGKMPVTETSPTEMPALVQTHTPEPTSTQTLEPTLTYTLETTATRTPTLIPTPTFTLEPTAAHTPTLIPTSQIGSCPLDMSLSSIISGYTDAHGGIDIVASYGTSHKSPGECSVVELYIGKEGVNGILLHCKDIPLEKIEMGHVDFKYDDYDTLKWYGIPIDIFFDSFGNAKRNVIGIQPRTHNTYTRGEDLHIYMGDTGDNSACVHTHITAWRVIDNNLNYKNDPCKYLDCCN